MILKYNTCHYYYYLLLFAVAVAMLEDNFKIGNIMFYQFINFDNVVHYRGSYGCRNDGLSVRDGDDEDDREACEHHQPAGVLYAGWTSLRYCGVRPQWQLERVLKKPSTWQQVIGLLNFSLFLICCM